MSEGVAYGFDRSRALRHRHQPWLAQPRRVRHRCSKGGTHVGCFILLSQIPATQSPFTNQTPRKGLRAGRAARAEEGG